MFTLYSSIKSTTHTYMYMETYKTSKNVQRIFKFVYTTFLSMVICLPMPTAIVHVCVVQTYATHKPTSNVCTIVNTSAGLGRLINKQSVLKKSVIIDLCLLQSIVRKQHAKWASLIVLNWKRVLIGGLTDHKWVEQLLMVKLMDELLINRVWCTDNQY